MGSLRSLPSPSAFSLISANLQLRYPKKELDNISKLQVLTAGSVIPETWQLVLLSRLPESPLSCSAAQREPPARAQKNHKIFKCPSRSYSQRKKTNNP